MNLPETPSNSGWGRESPLLPHQTGARIGKEPAKLDSLSSPLPFTSDIRPPR